jgi:hypothetical protein
LEKDVLAVSEINGKEHIELNLIRFEYLTLYLKQIEEYSLENSAVYLLEEVGFINLDKICKGRFSRIVSIKLY